MWTEKFAPVGLGWHAAPYLSIDHTDYGPPHTNWRVFLTQTTAGVLNLWYKTMLGVENQVSKGSDLTIFGTPKC